MIFLKLFIGFVSLCLVNGSFQEIPSTIRPLTNEDTQQQAALSVIRRVIGDKADDVTVKINFDLPGNSFKVKINQKADCMIVSHEILRIENNSKNPIHFSQNFKIFNSFP